MKKKTLLMALLTLSITIFGVDKVYALEGMTQADLNMIENQFTREPDSQYTEGNYAVQSIKDWIQNEGWEDYGDYYICVMNSRSSLNRCYIFDDYTKITWSGSSSANLFLTYNDNQSSMTMKSFGRSTSVTTISQNTWGMNNTDTNIAYRSNLLNYFLTGSLVSDDMIDYEDNYWKYSLEYQDFIVSIYDSERPSDINSYPFDIFINRENFNDTRITIYNVLSNQFVAEFTEPNLEYQYDERFIGFSHELKEGEVVRIITTATETRDYYITNMYTQSQILISDVVDGEAEYLNSTGITTPVNGMIDPPEKGMIVSVVEYQDYGNMDKLFVDVNSFISSTSTKSFLIFKPLGDLFNSLNPTLRSAIISIFVIYLAGVVLVLLRRG